jgi:ATP-dependent Clp protease ATP-binding subunit ClpA
LLQAIRADPGSIRQAVEDLVMKRSDHSDVKSEKQLNQIFEIADKERLTCGAEHLEPIHLLLAILAQDSTPLGAVLVNRGVTYSAIKNMLPQS